MLGEATRVWHFAHVCAGARIGAGCSLGQNVFVGDDDPNFLDVRSPGGAGIGQLAYSFDGKIFTSDEGRMLYATGDSFFELGDVRTTTYRQLMTHPTVRSLTLASNLNGQPDCVNCTYNPYCGMVPEQAYRTQGSIFGRMRDNELCAVHKAIDVLPLVPVTPTVNMPASGWP